jgi:hypothetical protein
MRMRFNQPRRAIGRAGKDRLKASPQGDIARLGKAINITADAHNYAVEQA